MYQICVIDLEDSSTPFWELTFFLPLPTLQHSIICNQTQPPLSTILDRFTFFSFPSFAFKSWHSSPGFKDIKKTSSKWTKKKTSKIHPQTSQKKAPVLFALVAIYTLYIFLFFSPINHITQHHSKFLFGHITPHHTMSNLFLLSRFVLSTNQQLKTESRNEPTSSLPSFLPSIQFLFLFPFSFYFISLLHRCHVPPKKECARWTIHMRPQPNS